MLTEADLPSFDLDGERYVRPDFTGLGVANVGPTVLRLLAPSATVDLPPLDRRVLPDSLAEGVKKIVLVVADGLGHLQLQREIRDGNAPTFGALIARAATGDELVAYSPLTSVFPTTTVAALGSINSAVPPTQHGLLGYTLYLREFNSMAEMIRWGPIDRRVTFADAEFGCQPETFFWAPTVYSRLQAAGVERTFAVNPGYFSGTALTRMLHQGATVTGYISTSSLQPIVERLVVESDQPTYIYAYWPTIDTIAHLIGSVTPEHSAEVAGFDFQIGRLLQSLPRRGDTLLLLTADHGHVDTSPPEEIACADHPELMALLSTTPAAERRAAYLYPKPGASGAVMDYVRERMADVASALLRDEAVALGLFGPGPLPERAAARIGEVLLFPRGRRQLVPPLQLVDGAVPKTPVFKALHGGLRSDEALVPLLAIRI